MSIREFLGGIESPVLREIARHWDEARGTNLLPAWSDIKPSAIKTRLPIVWSWKFDRTNGEFVGRLAGERIQSVFGTEFRGAPMSSVFGNRDYRRMYARHHRIVSEPALFIGRGLVFRHLERFDLGERIIMPLADDRKTADGIFGATDFRTQYGEIPEAVLSKGEEEHWFAVMDTPA